MSPAKPPTQRSSNTRIRRRRRTLFVLFPIAIAVMGYLLVRHYTRPERITAIAEAYLQQFTRGRVTVGDASFSLFGGVRLFDLRVDPVEREASGGGTLVDGDRPMPPVFSCRETKVTHNLLSMLVGDFRIRSIVASQPTCSIVRDTATGRTSLLSLFKVPEGGQYAPDSMPSFDLRDARIVVISREGDRDRVVGDLRLSFRALPSRQEPGVYNVVWEGGGGRTSSGYSQIDLISGRLRNIRGGLPWMSIEAVMLALDARYDGAGAWCELLGLDGNVRASDYKLGSGPRHRDASSATIELRNASISIPIDKHEHSLPAADRYLRFQRVNGHVEVTTDEIAAQFDGVFHGSECSVVATFRGGVDELTTLQDVGFDAKLTTKDLTLPRPDPGSSPAEVRFINRWHKLAQFYQDYDPRGIADLEFNVTKRPGEDQPIVVRRLFLKAKEGDASCRFFPYRLTVKGGTVEYTPDGLWIRNLRGERNGGTVLINGFLEKPTRTAAKEILINGTRIPIDDALIDCLPSRFREITEHFNPRGRLDVEVMLTQPEGEVGMPVSWQSNTTITLDDVSATYVRLPYPVDHLTGTLVVAKDKIQLLDLKGENGDTRVEIEGGAGYNREGMTDLDLAISAHGVALDKNLFSTLPADLRQQLEAFHPTGRFDCETSLTIEPETGAVRYSSQVTLEDVAVRHETLPVEVRGVAGRLTVTNDRIAVHHLTGGYEEATISAQGSVSWADGRFAPEFTIRTENLRLDDRVVAALPAKPRSLLRDWQIDGSIATETTIQAGPAATNGQTSIRTLVRLSHATLQHPKLPAPLHDVVGQVEIDGSVVRATGIEARYGSAKLHADLDFRRTAEGDEADIRLSATGIRLDDSMRGLLPEQIAGAWDRLHPEGLINLRLDSLRSYRARPDHPPEWSIVGYVELVDVGLPGAAELEGISGVLVGSGMVSDRLGGAHISGELSLTEMKLLGRRFSRIEADWSFARAADGRGFLVLEPARGLIYEGMATGKVEVAFDGSETSYSLAATIQGMQIEPFLNAPRNARLADRKPINARGVADVHFYLSGSVGEPSSKQGGGRLEILDGHIYRFPIILAILNVLNLSVPDEDVFEDARAEFFIAGDRMQLRDISLRGSVLGLVGSGTLSLPDQGVDLSFVNVGPRGWAAIPLLANVIEGTSRELVELHVTGPLSRPTVRARPFRGVREELERLFQKRKPRKIQPAGP